MPPSYPQRRSLRLTDYDYRQAGVYLVTLCVAQRTCRFGRIEGEEMVLSTQGRIVETAWWWLQEQYPYVELDEWITMPNHSHGLLVLTPEEGQKTKPLGRLIGAFKTVSTKLIHTLPGMEDEGIWQRDFYERVIRNEQELHRARTYIVQNPMKWSLDRENPDCVG
jgi:REP element-mobilizing transposase RayT